nr:UDP-N-acetylmuramoyl-tripeptide--D-alanyl-D-alanine ligase [Bacteroidota bacterium]
EKGAAFAIVDDASLPEHPQLIRVENSLKCLQELASWHRKQLKIPIIAIGGSNGKTTTKELISSVLRKKYPVYATLGNFNNHIGLPLSVLQIDPKHEIAILEIGANHLGENKLLIENCQPTHGIVTNIGKDHLGEFNGWDGIIKAYKEFIDFFNQNENLTFFLNTDDPQLTRLTLTENFISYSCKDQVETSYSAKLIDNSLFCKILLTKNKERKKYKIHSQLFGSYNIYNMLAAWAIGDHFKVPPEKIKEAIESYYPQNNRSQILKWKSNTIIMDAYNSNPSSLMLALKDFGNLSINNKTIIFGDMHELGTYSKMEHKNIVNQLNQYQFAHVLLVGKQFTEASNKDDYKCFTDVFALKKWIKNQIFKDAFILLKGSRSEKLELAFEGIL